MAYKNRDVTVEAITIASKIYRQNEGNHFEIVQDAVREFRNFRTNYPGCSTENELLVKHVVSAALCFISNTDPNCNSDVIDAAKEFARTLMAACYPVIKSHPGDRNES